MADLQISEVAARTGFTPSTLRYYEDVGLVSPERTAAGYRVYDGRAVDRLHFIGRAKQLGLNLDEIAELVHLWDGDRCDPVAERLRDLVAAKLDETERQIGMLGEFAAELRHAVATVGARHVEGACGPDCACESPPASGDGPVPVDLVRREPASEPIVCTLDVGALPGRVEEWGRLAGRAVSREVLEGGLRLRFATDDETDYDIAADVVRLAAAEQRCCSFFDFTIHIWSGGIDLDVKGPADALTLVHELLQATA